MSKFFLWNLYKTSKPFFVFAICFLLLFAVFFNKGMDMLFFPYNNMYSESFSNTHNSTTFAVKINNVRINITNDLYLKKDFSETSLHNFSLWASNKEGLFMSAYLKQKNIDSTKKARLLKVLVPDSSTMLSWPIWFAKFHTHHIEAGSVVEIWKYNFNVVEKEMLLLDSALILKEQIP